MTKTSRTTAAGGKANHLKALFLSADRPQQKHHQMTRSLERWRQRSHSLVEYVTSSCCACHAHHLTPWMRTECKSNLYQVRTSTGTAVQQFYIPGSSFVTRCFLRSLQTAVPLSVRCALCCRTQGNEATQEVQGGIYHN